MAVDVQVPKLAKVYLDAVLLGYTRNGSEIISMPHHIMVHGDEHGGDEGPPIDVQALPTLYRIQLSLTRFEKAELEKIEATILSGTAGTYAAADIGVPYVGGSKAFRVTIQTTNAAWIRNFPKCVPVGPPSYNLGTRFVEASVEFMALRDTSNGLVWNTTAAV